MSCKGVRPYYKMHEEDERIGGRGTMLWTIVPLDELLEDESEPYSVAEMSVDGVTVVVHKGADGKGRVERLLSTNPAHYLQPQWQPGAPWPGRGAGR